MGHYPFNRAPPFRQDPDHICWRRHHRRGRHHGAEGDGLLLSGGELPPHPDSGGQAAAQHGQCPHPPPLGGEAHVREEAQGPHQQAGPSQFTNTGTQYSVQSRYRTHCTVGTGNERLQ